MKSQPVCADELLSLVHDLDDQGVHAYHLLEDGPGMNNLGDVRFVDAWSGSPTLLCRPSELGNLTSRC